MAAARGQHAEAAAAEIREAGGRAVAVSVDVTDVARIDAMVRTALDEFGRVDVLVNNAGIVRDRLVLRTGPGRLGRGRCHEPDGGVHLCARGVAPEC